MQRRTVERGVQPCSYVRAGGQGRAGNNHMAAPGPAARHRVVRSTTVPHESFQTPTSKSRQLRLVFCLPGFLSLSCLLVNHSGDICKPWGTCLFLAFLLNQTLLPKTSDEALCLPLGKVFTDLKTSTPGQLYDYQVAE